VTVVIFMVRGMKNGATNPEAQSLPLRFFQICREKQESLQRASQNLLLSVDNVNESRLQASTTNKETIDISLLSEVLAVLLADGAAVDNTGGLGDLLAELLVEPLADALVNLLRLLGGSDLAGADGPDGLVGDDDLAPVLHLLADGRELVDDDFHGLVGLALLESLANAEDDVDASVESGLGLVGDESVALLEDYAALAVADQSPGDVGVLELRGGDLAGESTVGLVEDVLGGDLDALAGVLAGEEEVEGGWGDDDR
jgi:hypothetical protein